MPFGGGRFFSYARWIMKKKAQVLGRTHLSHVFAILLGALTVYREWRVFWSIYLSFDFGDHVLLILAVVGAILLLTLIPLRFGGWELGILLLTSACIIVGLVSFIFFAKIEFLIVTITVITILAAGWELVGNKLTTSPQEIRFVTAMRSLLPSLQKLTYGEDREPDLEKRLDDFLEGFLEVTSKTLCGTTQVDGGFMREVPNQKKLELHKSSKLADYPPELFIPVPDVVSPIQNETGEEDEGEGPGPAGVAYARLQTVYMPFKRLKRAWPFQLIGRRYEPSEPTHGWVAADQPMYERFCSVLCSPVAVYRKKNSKRPFGVLNYSTKARDPFVDRDFAMSECFSSILAQAMEAIRREALERERAKKANPQV
jgi:hypothetical protein